MLVLVRSRLKHPHPRPLSHEWERGVVEPHPRSLSPLPFGRGVGGEGVSVSNISKRVQKVIFTLLLSFAIATPAWADEPLKPNLNDPYETYNRHAYNMNKKVDQVVFKPLACLYKTITPSPVRKGINNFLSNLSEIPIILNDLLQANVPQASRDLARLAVNTTIGLGGFLDIASNMGLEKNPQDFGLTLAKWGYKCSNYFVLPIIGPSTVRDALAWPIYYQMTVYPYIPDNTLRYTLLSLDYIDLRAQFLDLDPVIEQSFDPYVFERDAYIQRRNYLIRKNDGCENPAPTPASFEDNGKSHDDTHDATADTLDDSASKNEDKQEKQKSIPKEKVTKSFNKNVNAHENNQHRST